MQRLDPSTLAKGKRALLVVKLVALWAFAGGIAAGLASLVRPLSAPQLVVSVMGFGAFGLFVGVSEFGPLSCRAYVARTFASRWPTSREWVLWAIAFVVIAAAALVV
jgi:hypothetical protein